MPENLLINSTYVIVGLILLTYIAMGFGSVNQWQRRPVMFFGWYAWTAGPGIIWVPPIIFQSLRDESVQSWVDELVIEGARTKNNIPLKVKAIITWRVDAARVRDFVLNVKNGRTAVKQRAEAAAVTVIGSEPFRDIQNDREKFSGDVTKTLVANVANWGVVIDKVEIINIEITDTEIAEAVAREAIADANTTAENIMSDGLEQASQKYGVDMFVLRQLIAAERIGGSPGSVIFQGSMLDSLMKNPGVLERLGRTGGAALGSAEAGGAGAAKATS